MEEQLKQEHQPVGNSVPVGISACQRDSSQEWPLQAAAHGLPPPSTPHAGTVGSGAGVLAATAAAPARFYAAVGGALPIPGAVAPGLLEAPAPAAPKAEYLSSGSIPAVGYTPAPSVNPVGALPSAAGQQGAQHASDQTLHAALGGGNPEALFPAAGGSLGGLGLTNGGLPGDWTIAPAATVNALAAAQMALQMSLPAAVAGPPASEDCTLPQPDKSPMSGAIYGSSFEICSFSP